MGGSARSPITIDRTIRMLEFGTENSEERGLIKLVLPGESENSKAARTNNPTIFFLFSPR